MSKPSQRKPSQKIVNALLKVATRQQLTAAGLTDDQKAWELLDTANAPALDALIAQTGKDKKAFLSAFTEGALRLSNEHGFSRMELSWFDFAICAAALTVVGLIVVLSWHQFGGQRRVVAARDLAAFAPLRPGDIKLDLGVARAGEFKDLGELGARYPLVVVKKGTALNESDFSGGAWKQEAGEASLLEIPLKAGWDFAGWQMPVKALLVASPRQGNAANAVTLPVLVVAVKAAKNATSVLVSTASANKSQLASFQAALGSSDVFAAAIAPN